MNHMDILVMKGNSIGRDFYLDNSLVEDRKPHHHLGRLVPLQVEVQGSSKADHQHLHHLVSRHSKRNFKPLQ
jgi:hypothetical protein